MNDKNKIDNKGINFYSFKKDETSHRILSLKQQLLDEEKNLVRYDIELQELRSWDKPTLYVTQHKIEYDGNMFYEHKSCFYEHKTYSAAKTTYKESMVDLFKIYKPSEMQRAKQAGYKEKEASLNEDNTKCD